MCRVHPQSELASGTDVAFCWPVEPVLAARLIPPVALGCAHEQLQPGVPLTLVGYGVDGSGLEALGTKRSITAEIGAIGREITVGDEERGPCSGDSGGPAFMSLSASDGASEWVLAGILSSGVEGSRCSTGYYTDLSQVMTWLESETGRDLTPCFDGVTWRPTERCLRAALDERGLPLEGPEQPSQSCGAPYRAEHSADGDAGCSQAAPTPRGRSAVAIAMVGLALLGAARFRRATRAVRLPI